MWGTFLLNRYQTGSHGRRQPVKGIPDGLDGFTPAVCRSRKGEVMSERRKNVTKGIIVVGIMLLLLSTMFLSSKLEETVQRNADKVQEENKIESGEEDEQKQTWSGEQVQGKSDNLKEKNRQEKVEADAKEREEKIDSVTVTYERTGDAAGVEIIRENEDNLKVFLAEKGSGNGVKQGGESQYSEIQATIKNVVDKGGYVTFVCNFKGTDVSMVYYKDSGQFAFQEADLEPGRTNNYQVVGEDNKEKLDC